MPEMDGIEAQILIKEFDSRLPVIALTANVMKEDIEYYFNYLDFDYRIRRMIYTTNWIERFNKSCRRTLKIRNSFPSPEAALALITSVAIEKGEKKYAYPIHNFKFEEKFMNETCSIH